MHTLLIDDDPIVTLLTERLLRHEGLSDMAALFQSPTEALTFLLRQIPAGLVPQVILMDLNMLMMSDLGFMDILNRHEVRLQGQCIAYLLTSSVALADEGRAKARPLVAGLLLRSRAKVTIAKKAVMLSLSKHRYRFV